MGVGSIAAARRGRRRALALLAPFLAASCSLLPVSGLAGSGGPVEEETCVTSAQNPLSLSVSSSSVTLSGDLSCPLDDRTLDRQLGGYIQVHLDLSGPGPGTRVCNGWAATLTGLVTTGGAASGAAHVTAALANSTWGLHLVAVDPGFFLGHGVFELPSYFDSTCGPNLGSSLQAAPLGPGVFTYIANAGFPY